MKRFAPIGCRDEHTLKVMEKYSIPAYLFGCMTMTFPRVYQHDRDKTTVFCIDVSEKLISHIPLNMKEKCVYLSNAYNIEEIEGTVEEKAQEVYSMLINRAKLVITARLHVALPCIAAGVPVIFAKDIYSYRFVGINRVVKAYSEEEYPFINWEAESPEYEELKQRMLRLAMYRLKSKFEERMIIDKYNKTLENNPMRRGVVESVYNTEHYLQELFKEEDAFEYIIWSVTQTADLIYNFVYLKYKKAKLAAVVDRSKKVNFHGVLSCTKEIIMQHRNAVVLVCSDAAIPEAEAYFKNNKIKNYYYCCLNDMKFEDI